MNHQNYETKIRISGVTSIKTAKEAKIFGADSIGLLIEVGYSKFDVNRFQAKEILHHIGGETVMITTLDSPQSIIELSDFVDTTHIQVTQMMHEEELSEIKEKTQKRIIYNIPVINEGSIEVVQKYEDHCDYILLNASNTVYNDETETQADWLICKEIIESSKKPIIIAGGLTPENVAKVVETTTPYGVDVSSGVSTKGKKDLDKIIRFIKAIQNK